MVHDGIRIGIGDSKFGFRGGIRRHSGFQKITARWNSSLEFGEANGISMEFIWNRNSTQIPNSGGTNSKVEEQIPNSGGNRRPKSNSHALEIEKQWNFA